ncbi:MAG: hypothetical protein JSV89_11530 [Spirochaetaceae bacterium]|nr:MAG: hypothetical protein JSV89_11530 [Spirochaetaceae bacterium]
MESLNSLVAYYQNTGLGLAEIVKRLSLRIYNYPRGKFQAGEDDCGEFYLFFYPRLLRSLARFEDRGKPFEWYFNSILRWHYKAYCSQKRQEQSRWAVARNALFWEHPEPVMGAYLPNSGSDGHENIIPIDRLGRSRDTTWRRRILFLALKNARQLDEAGVAWISDLTGIGQDHLIGMIERLRASLYKRELRLHKLYYRQNRAFTKILLLQQELLWEVDPGRKVELALSLCDLRKTLHGLQGRIRRVRLHPSNRQIAELLQIPKGTVDTSLFWLRRQLLRSDNHADPEQKPQLCA